MDIRLMDALDYISFTSVDYAHILHLAMSLLCRISTHGRFGLYIFHFR